ncbi:hypothetical protein D3C76_1780080 [compost metagenome]
MPGGRSRDAADLSPDADAAELALEHAFDRARDLGDGELMGVAAGGVFEKLHDRVLARGRAGRKGSFGLIPHRAIPMRRL